MVKQYPHVLFANLFPAGDSAQDSEGNWSEKTPTPTLLSECREVTDGRGRELQGADGKMHKYTSVIFLPLTCPDIAFGATIYVKDTTASTSERIRGTALKFDRGQMHCRLWV